MILVYEILTNEEFSGNTASAALYDNLKNSDSLYKRTDRIGLGKHFQKGKHRSPLVTAAFEIKDEDNGKGTVRVKAVTDLETLAKTFKGGDDTKRINANEKKHAICLALIIVNNDTTQAVYEQAIKDLIALYSQPNFQKENQRDDILRDLKTRSNDMTRTTTAPAAETQTHITIPKPPSSLSDSNNESPHSSTQEDDSDQERVRRGSVYNIHFMGAEDTKPDAEEEKPTVESLAIPVGSPTSVTRPLVSEATQATHISSLLTDTSPSNSSAASMPNSPIIAAHSSASSSAPSLVASTVPSSALAKSSPASPTPIPKPSSAKSLSPSAASVRTTPSVASTSFSSAAILAAMTSSPGQSSPALITTLPSPALSSASGTTSNLASTSSPSSESATPLAPASPPSPVPTPISSGRTLTPSPATDSTSSSPPITVIRPTAGQKLTLSSLSSSSVAPIGSVTSSTTTLPAASSLSSSPATNVGSNTTASSTAPTSATPTSLLSSMISTPTSATTSTNAGSVSNTTAAGGQRKRKKKTTGSNRMPSQSTQFDVKAIIASADIKDFLDKIPEKVADNLKTTKAAQERYFSAKIKQFNETQLLAINTHLDQVQHGKEIDARFDVIRKERRFFGHGNTATWQHIRHKVKEQLLALAELRHGVTQKGEIKTIPASEFKVDYEIYNQHTGHFWSHIGKTNSAKLYEKMYKPDPAMRPKRHKS